MQLTITKIPHLDTMVVKQRGAHFFIAAPDSFVIGKNGFLQLIKGALKVNFISAEDISEISAEIGVGIEN